MPSKLDCGSDIMRRIRRMNHIHLCEKGLLFQCNPFRLHMRTHSKTHRMNNQFQMKSEWERKKKSSSEESTLEKTHLLNEESFPKTYFNKTLNVSNVFLTWYMYVMEIIRITSMASRDCERKSRNDRLISINWTKEDMRWQCLQSDNPRECKQFHIHILLLWFGKELASQYNHLCASRIVMKC